jgi:saccharopine dehydrogenase-like NADP-dependent oxidoreductase
MANQPYTISQRILVLGAGELGLAIISALRAHPSRPDVAVLLRPDSSSTNSIPNDIDIIPGNLSDPVEALADILRPFEIVISAVPVPNSTSPELLSTLESSGISPGSSG